VTARRPEHAFATIVLFAYLPVALFAIGHHEMWRDELHCWLVARDSATPWDVVRNRAYDGHPPLWYLILWVLQRTTHAPLSMQIAHVAIATACVWVFASHAPFGRLPRALFPFGYFVAYEYVAISRCYGLALLFVLLLCIHHPRRFERPGRTAILVSALALTTTVSTVIAAAYVLVLFVEAIDLRRSGDGDAARLAWFPIAVGVLSCAAAALLAWPPADSTVAHIAWPTTLPSDDAPTRLIVALAPIPRADFFFWNSNALLSWAPFRRVAFPVSLALAGWILFVLSRNRAATLLFGAGALLLVALFGGVYGGDVRHHGFLFVLFLMAAWIAQSSPRPRPGLALTVTAVLIAHVAGAPIALFYEWRYIFSSGRRAAEVIRAQGLADSPLVAEVDYPATAAIGYLGPRAFALSPRTGRPFSYVKWTRDRHWDPTDAQTLRFASEVAAKRQEPAVLLMNRPLVADLVDGLRVKRVAELYDSMIEEENFFIYVVARPPS
jgi:hypothetical protein